MSNVAKLKKRALEFEQKKQFDRALATYQQLLSELDEHVDEADVALYNRVGDLLLRDGDVSGAADHYERAVDLYAEGGFFNNAIALCNKILRNAPGRNSIYYKLGKISAQKGFINDARQNFLEYADRMQRAGKIAEAFQALKEFADLCPDQEDIRLMLADQLAKGDRRGEAIEQLQRLYDKFATEGRTTEARATLDRIKAIEPGFEPAEPPKRPARQPGDLIFLDVDFDAPRGAAPRTARAATPPSARAATPPAATPVEAADSRTEEPLTVGEAPPVVDAPAEQDPLDAGMAVSPGDSSAALDSLVSNVGADWITGFEETELPSSRMVPVEPEPIAGFEPTAEPVADTLDFELLRDDVEVPLAPPEPAPLAVVEPAGLAHDPAPPAPDLIAPAPVPPPAPTDSAVALEAGSASWLRAEIERAPDDWELHRRFGEALLEEGDREGGLAQLEVALLGYERDADLRGASRVADELLRVQPNSTRFHQKRVEYAVRANDKPRLVEAYLDLAECLVREGEVPKARAVYHRVLELSPADARARTVLQSLGTGDTPVPPAQQLQPAPQPPVAHPGPAPAAVAVPRALEPPAEPTPPADGFVDLGEWLREVEPVRNTRMVVDLAEPGDQQQTDFTEMLEMFKEGVAQNLDETDYESHYDLGVAYKEMGLTDEAIAEFQKALRGTEHRVRTYEALGQCFVEKRQYQIALTILTRAINDRTSPDDVLVAVLYLAGYASEALGRMADAQRFYERVFAVDIHFRDVAERLSALERAPR